MQSYPRMLYRAGSQIEWSGLNLDTLIVDDEQGEKAAVASGWRTAADVLSAKPSEAETVAALKAEIAKFDPDGDGKIGGAVKRKRKAR